MDYANGRYSEGNLVVIANSCKGDKETYRKNKSTEWLINDDATVSTCRKTSYVLGLKVDTVKA